MLEETLLEWGEKLRTEARAEGRSEGRSEGRNEGRIDGMRRLLVRQMEQSFGPLPRALRQSLRAIDSQRELERLGARVLTAKTLQDLPRP